MVPPTFRLCLPTSVNSGDHPLLKLPSQVTHTVSRWELRLILTVIIPEGSPASQRRRVREEAGGMKKLLYIVRNERGAREMTCKIRALAAVLGHLGSNSSNHMPAHNHLLLQSQISDTFIWHQACMWFTDVHAIKTPICKAIKKLKQIRQLNIRWESKCTGNFRWLREKVCVTCGPCCFSVCWRLFQNFLRSIK